FGCAQGVPGQPPVDAEATTPQQPDGGPGDGGVAAGPCDPSIAASEGVAIVDTGACPGVIPAASTCAAEITICSGLGSGDTGDAQLIAQSFAADGTSRMTTAIGAFTGSAGSLMLSGATSSTGATLVVWQIQGEANATARWLAADGSASSAPFSIAGWSSSAPQTAALAGGAIAIAAEPQSGVATRSWRGIVAAGDTVVRAARGLLASG